MKLQSLSAEDVALLYAEPTGPQLQIGALCIFEAKPLRDDRGRLRLAELKAHVASRLDALPRFRQRIAPVVADIAAPVWVDDVHFDVARHTARVELSPPGGVEALREFIDQLLSEPMDTAHPLWDLHVVEGVSSEVIAVVLRAHHVMADGLALHAAATLLLDRSPRAPQRRIDEWTPEPAPGDLRLAAAALAQRTCRRTSLTVEVARSLLDPRVIVSNGHLAGRVLSSVREGRVPTAPPLAFTGPVGPRRAFAWDTVPMAEVLAVKHACGVTVNDVVLAIATGAVRRQLQAIGAFDPSGHEPRAVIPIGGHEGPGVAWGNHFSISAVGLPVGVDDPLERVALIRSRTQRSTTSGARPLVRHLMSIADVLPLPLLRALAPRVLEHQPLVNLAVSNVPGARDPLYLWGARLLRLHPFITGAGNIALIIGVLSYLDGLGVGITVDPDRTGDPRVIAGHVRAAASELAALVP